MKSIVRKWNRKVLVKIASMLILLCLTAASTGCSVNRATASLSPGADLNKIKSFYLIPGKEDEDNYKIIQSNLEHRGYSVITGPEMPLPYKSDAVINYIDRWMWDFTPYMLELTITFRDPNTNYPLAVGNSLHTSLSRKSAEEMVDEVLTNIFAAKPAQSQSGNVDPGAASAED